MADTISNYIISNREIFANAYTGYTFPIVYVPARHLGINNLVSEELILFLILLHIFLSL